MKVFEAIVHEPLYAADCYRGTYSRRGTVDNRQIWRVCRKVQAANQSEKDRGHISVCAKETLQETNSHHQQHTQLNAVTDVCYLGSILSDDVTIDKELTSCFNRAS